MTHFYTWTYMFYVSYMTYFGIMFCARDNTLSLCKVNPALIETAIFGSQLG